MTAIRSRPVGPEVQRATVDAGHLLRRTVLGSDAIYRVVGRNARGIEVEVVNAPGLRAGSRFTFLPEDVAAMDAVNS